MKVIATKKRKASTNPIIGYVQPLLKMEDGSTDYEPVEIEMFPNDGEIFVIRDYSLIDSLNEDQLFELNDISVNKTSYDRERPGSCFYTATTNYWRLLTNTEFIPIYTYKFNIKTRKIEYSNISERQIFLLENEGFVYGPFNYNSTIKELTAININELDLTEDEDDYNLEEVLSESKDCIFKIAKSDLSTVSVGNFIPNLSELVNRPIKDVIYFGSKEDVFDWGKEVFKTTLTDNEKQLLLKLKGIIIPKIANNIDKVKLELFKTSLSDANTWLNIELPKHIHSFLMTDEGKSFVDNYLEDNKVMFFDTYRKVEIESIDNELVDKNKKLTDLTLRIDELNDSLESQENKIFDGIPEEEKVQLKTIIKNPEERTLLLSYFKQNKDLNEIQKVVYQKQGERSTLQVDIDNFKRQQRIIQEAIIDVKTEFFKDSDFAKKLIDAKLYTDLLNNIDPSAASETKQEIQILKPYHVSTDILSPKQFVQEVTNRLRKTNRKLSFNEVANHLITLSQNFLTIYAGLPGVGKTSLVQKYAQVLGLQSNKKYLSIAVPRGWTSSKDLLGYFNPLKNKFQYSKTGLTQFLEGCERDIKADNEMLSLVLLDEANMSPIEHYWSDFLTVSDKDYEKSINKTDSERVNYGSYLRFVATINYDHTTEILSDRLLSRAPVIKLLQTDYSFEEEIINEDFSEMFSLKQYEIFNSVKFEKDNFKGDIKNKFESILKVLQDDSGLGQPIILGMRKYRAIENYCNSAIGIMEPDEVNRFIPLDYAVNQFILPLINGRGDGFLKKLELLQEKLKGMPNSYNQIANIIAFGNENFKNYKFFY